MEVAATASISASPVYGFLFFHPAAWDDVDESRMSPRAARSSQEDLGPCLQGGMGGWDPVP